MKHWAVDYIGLPYKSGGRDRGGVDCWGLLRLIYKEQFKIELPELTGINLDSVLTACETADRELSDSWLEIEKPIDGCAVGMSQLKRNRIHHVGIYATADSGRVIHSWHKSSVIAESMRRLKLKGFREIKFYRHRLWPSS